MSAIAQYAIDDAKIYQGFSEISLKVIQTSLQNNYLDLKIKEREARMERCLYHCKATNKDVQNSNEDAICFKSYLVKKSL
jgi:hypothetical protein